MTVQTLGAIILCIACGLPFSGCFFLLLDNAFTGIGATILGFFQKS